MVQQGKLTALRPRCMVRTGRAEQQLSSRAELPVVQSSEQPGYPLGKDRAKLQASRMLSAPERTLSSWPQPDKFLCDRHGAGAEGSGERSGTGTVHGTRHGPSISQLRSADIAAAGQYAHAAAASATASERMAPVGVTPPHQAGFKGL